MTAFAGGRETLPERILITGGRGFVGVHLTAAIALKHPNWAISAPSLTSEHGALYLDVTEPESIAKTVRDFRPTAVVHLAAIAAVTDAAKFPRKSWNVNLDGVLNLTEVMRRLAPACRLLFVSSAEVYGRSHFTGERHDEGMLLQPTNAYAASKAAADIHVRQQAFEGLPAVVVRPFNHIGRGQSDRFAIPSFASQIAAIERVGRPAIMEVGSLDDERDFLDVEDIVDAYISILEQKDLARGLVLNLASGKARRMGDLLQVLLSHSTAHIEIRQVFDRLRPEGVTRITGDAGLARRVLNWAPMRSIDETLLSILDYERRRKFGPQ